MPTQAINVVELRQYTLHGGRRDDLIALFEREFIHTQEAVGARILGTFRDLDDPDRFVWLRGFAGMKARTQALTAFYTGPAWRAHRQAANATMLDSDNVLLLRPWGTTGSSIERALGPGGLLTAHIHTLGRTDPEAFARFFDAELGPRLRAAGAAPVATFVPETGRNDFPRLPVRTDEPVFVWFAAHADEAAERAAAERLARMGGWRDDVPAALLPALMRKPERIRLTPTAPSRPG